MTQAAYDAIADWYEREFLVTAFLDAGLVLDRFTEGGGPVPVMFGVRAGKR
jgi:hypothetical protein